jgi:tripartite-type tricarboxylate transporter receptor subunit TctC
MMQSSILAENRGIRRGRSVAILALMVAAALAPTKPALAQQPLRLVVPFPAGGSVDRAARLLSPYLAEGLARQVVIENRPGAGGTIGAEYVARAEPDGTRLLLSNAALAESAANSVAKLDPRRDLRPVIQLATSQYFLVANANLGARDVFDLAALGKRKPGGLNCGGAPGAVNLGCAGLRAALGDGIETIPYQGMGPASKALLSGEVDVMFAGRSNLLALVASGRVVVLATATDQPAAPPWERVPLLKEAYPGIDVSGFTGVFVAAGTPDALVQQYNREFNRILARAEVRAAFQGVDIDATGGSPEALALSLAHELENYRRLAPVSAAKTIVP